jgi:putative transcriptional regulator
MIAHHPGEELLIAYAAGASGEAASLLVATHLALCPECRREVTDAERAGGALLDDMVPVPMSDSALANTMARLNGAEAKLEPRERASANGLRAPEPLRSWIGGDLDQVRWIPVTRGIAYRPILKRNRTTAQLVRSKPGHGISLHTHRGEEYSLVLTGGYTDPTGHYLRGDVQTATPELLHHPITDEGEDCITLAVADAPLAFSNRFVGLLAKFMGY